MPPSFMNRISRSSSGLVTDGPNHHQRTIMRASSGGRSKPRRSSNTFTRSAPKANPAISVKNALRLNHRTDISTMVCLRSRSRQAVSATAPLFQSRKHTTHLQLPARSRGFIGFRHLNTTLSITSTAQDMHTAFCMAKPPQTTLDPFDATYLNHRSEEHTSELQSL